MSQAVAEAYEVAAPREKSSQRIPSLDGLRAISILAVLFGHVAYACHFQNWITGTYAHYGVRVFFVISGYLITTLLLEEESRLGSISLSRFFLRRTFRIFPVAYLYLLAMTPFVAMAAWKWVVGVALRIDLRPGSALESEPSLVVVSRRTVLSGLAGGNSGEQKTCEEIGLARYPDRRCSAVCSREKI
jgi:hypothetical protein